MIMFLTLSAKTSSAYVSGQENLKITTQSQSELDEDNIDIVHQKGQEPMPVTLSFLALSPKKHNGQYANHIEWMMGSEIGTRGFYILRSTTDAYTDAAVISEFISCFDGMHLENMNQYEYWDTNIILDQLTYVYWLKEMKESGHVVYGPFYISGSRTAGELIVEEPAVEEPEGTNKPDTRIYLPIITY